MKAVYFQMITCILEPLKYYLSTMNNMVDIDKEEEVSGQKIQQAV